MRLGLRDIDPELGATIEERLTAPLNDYLMDEIRWAGWIPYRLSRQDGIGGPRIVKMREPTEREREAFRARQRREGFMGIALAISAVVAMLVGVLLAAAAALWVGLTAWMTCIVAGIVVAARTRPKRRLARSVDPTELEAVLPLLNLSRPERLYCDALLAIAAMPEPESSSSHATLLKELNGLLAANRAIEARKRSILPLLGSHSPDELEAEEARIAARLEAEMDPVVRQSREQSLRLCQSRLENGRALARGLERLNAQQEAITHALASATSSMARLQMGYQGDVAFTHEMAEVTADIQQQSRAVEQAVEEVLQLRQPG